MSPLSALHRSHRWHSPTLSCLLACALLLTSTDASARYESPTTASKPAPPPAEGPKDDGQDDVPAPAPPADEDDTDEAADTPQRLPRIQVAGWWTLFGGFALGTVAGALGGLAQRQEDRAVRLAIRYDLATGAQPFYRDIRSDYEDALVLGRRYERAGIALGVIAGVFAIAGIAILATDAARSARRSKATAQRVGFKVRDGLALTF